MNTEQAYNVCHPVVQNAATDGVFCATCLDIERERPRGATWNVIWPYQIDRFCFEHVPDDWPGTRCLPWHSLEKSEMRAWYAGLYFVFGVPYPVC